jgi:FlaA1/EpsC-like NDP-sugar epimerase
MARYFQKLVSKEHYKVTVLFFVLFIITLTTAIFVDGYDRLSGIILSITSSTFLILTLIHISRKPSHYFILAGICLLLVALSWFAVLLYGVLTSPEQQYYYDKYVERIMFILTFFVSLPGIIVGVLGGAYWAKKENNNLDSMK